VTRLRSIERNGRHHHVRLEHRGRGLALYLDDVLQLSSADEWRYHAALVGPLLSVTADPSRVLILGGGDGCAARDVLHRAPNADILIVDHEPAVLELASTDARLLALNRGSLLDPRVTVICEEAAVAVGRHAFGLFDAVIVDLTDPGHPGHDAQQVARVIELASALVDTGGGMVAQCGSPFIHGQWDDLQATFRASTAGRSQLSYLVEVPSFGCWSFCCAARRVPSLEAVGSACIALGSPPRPADPLHATLPRSAT
jgi:spermidine synthase